MKLEAPGRGRGRLFIENPREPPFGTARIIPNLADKQLFCEKAVSTVGPLLRYFRKPLRGPPPTHGVPKPPGNKKKRALRRRLVAGFHWRKGSEKGFLEGAFENVPRRRKYPFLAGASRGNTIRGNTTASSERKMALFFQQCSQQLRHC